MIFASLASGSSGNCTLAVTDEAVILIDCGISAKRIDDGLKRFGLLLRDVDGVFLTHEHSDHIKGLKRLMSAFGIPVYASAGTLESLAHAAKDEYFRYAGKELMHAVRADEEIEVKGVRILPFAISHDAASPLAYRLTAEQTEAFSVREQCFIEPGDMRIRRKKVSVGVTTDTGYFDDAMRDHMLGLDAVLLEANHDRGMLSNGPYPMYLKRRIMSRQGHLCNHAAGQLISEIIHPGLALVLLGHLSKENNTPALALSTVRLEVSNLCGERVANELRMAVAPPDAVSEIAVL